jgi:N,N'-diacetyllegionaminate synthase
MKVKVIAEIGNNHGGNFDLACKMVDAARKSGADFAKFQIYRTNNFLSKDSLYFSEFENEDLTFENFEKIYNKYNSNEFKVIATPFDPESARFLLSLGIETIKIASGDIDNFLMFNEIKNKKTEIIFSTGGASDDEILSIFNHFTNKDFKKIIPMHCIANYPANDNELKLNEISRLQNLLNCNVGYSDHSLGLLAPIIAASLGAVLIEKHFTIDKNLPGGDNEMSVNQQELREIVDNLKVVETFTQTPKQKFSDSEIHTKKLISRRFFALKEIKKGEMITYEHLNFLRTDQDDPQSFTGTEYEILINKIAKVDILTNQLILKNSICQN